MFNRYSLNGHIKPIPPPLISVDTNHSPSSGSEASLPAVYGLPVHSRPSSRYSNRYVKSFCQTRTLKGFNDLTFIRSHRSGKRSVAGQQTSNGGSHYSKYSNGRMIIK